MYIIGRFLVDYGVRPYLFPTNGGPTKFILGHVRTAKTQCTRMGPKGDEIFNIFQFMKCSYFFFLQLNLAYKGERTDR